MILTNLVEMNVQYQQGILWPFLLSWTIMNAPKINIFPRFQVKQKDLRISKSIVTNSIQMEKLVDQALALLNSNSAIPKGKFSKLFNSYIIISNSDGSEPRPGLGSARARPFF